MPSFSGSMVAVITPMRGGISPDASIDWSRFERLLDFHVANGTDAIVAVGTTGESATLSAEEHCEAIRRVVAHIDGRIPVIAGTGANSTTEAIHLTERARHAGARWSPVCVADGAMWQGACGRGCVAAVAVQQSGGS